MAEYIERTALEKCILGLTTVDPAVAQYANAVLSFLKDAPAADVAPVVRCRECKHYRENITKKYGNLICRCTRMGKYDMDYPVRPDDFCSRGERK